jgi:hypothetical protein
MEQTTKKDPLWKQAVFDARREFSYGETITLEWLQDSFELRPPERGTKKEFQDYQFKFLAALEAFKTSMLENHKMYLKSARGIGYLIVEPDYQSEVAWSTMRKSVRKSLNKAHNALINVQVAMLSNNARRENTDKLAKLSLLNNYNGKVKCEKFKLQPGTEDNFPNEEAGRADSGEAEKAQA